MNVGVMALNVSQFWFHVRELVPEPAKVSFTQEKVDAPDGTRYFYIRDAMHLRGMQPFKLVRVGQWFMRNDRNDIELQHKCRLAPTIPPSEWAEWGVRNG